MNIYLFYMAGWWIVSGGYALYVRIKLDQAEARIKELTRPRETWEDKGFTIPFKEKNQ